LAVVYSDNGGSYTRDYGKAAIDLHLWVPFEVGNPGAGVIDISVTVNTPTPADQILPSATRLSGGNYVVTWTDTGDYFGVPAAGTSPIGDGNSSAVIARIVDIDGQFVTAPIVVNTTTAGEQSDSSVARLSNGGFVITWRDGASGVDGVKAQLFNSAGAKSGGEFAVSAGEASRNLSPEVTSLSDGKFIVVWTALGNDSDSSDYGAFARIFNANGSAFGNEFLISPDNTIGTQSTPTVAAIPTGGFIIAWSEQNSASGDGSGGSVRAQVFDGSGVRTGAAFVVETTTLGNQGSPSISFIDSHLV